MELTCRKKDILRFEEIGFIAQLESYEFPNCVEMVDYEANYAHAEDLPGKTYLEQATDGGGGFIVMFDDQGNPDPATLAEVKTFITHANNVRVLLAKRRPGKRANARLAQAPNFSPAKGEMKDATKP